MKKRLLIAVDGSQAAKAALAEAIALAEREDAELRLTHVVDETAVAWGELARPHRRALNALASASAKVLDDAEAMIRAAGREASCARLRRERTVESVSDLIAAEADAWGADLIVLGTRGYGPIRRALHGSVDTAVMRKAKVPVLAVRPTPNSQGDSGHPATATPVQLGLA